MIRRATTTNPVLRIYRAASDFTPRAYFSTTRQSLLTSAPRTAHQLHRFTTVSPSPAYNRPHINHPSPFSRSRSIRSFRFDFPNRSSAKRVHTDQTNSVQNNIPLEGATDGLARDLRPRSPQGWEAWRAMSGRAAGIFFGAALFATAVRFKWQYLLSGATMTLLAVLSHKIYKGSLLERRMKIFWVALKVFLDYKATQKRDSWSSSQSVKDLLWERAHERNAARVYASIVSLEGVWVKAGQYLSTRADVLPEPYIERLRLLQDALPPRPLKEVYGVVEEGLGKPVSEAFKYFDPVPLGTASIAQVHRAVSLEGEEVVVKVQHVGIKQKIMQDLSNLGSIVRWVAWSEPDYNFKPVLDEWAMEVPKELDFTIEAGNTERVAKNLDYSSDLVPGGTHVDVMIPRIIKATEKVMVMTYMAGVRLNDIDALDKLGVDKQVLVDSITRAYAHQIYVDGFFNADPHPGNFLVSVDPPHRAVLLDFGLTKELRPHVQLALAKMLLAAAENDLAMLLSSFTEMGLKIRMDVSDDAMQVAGFFFRRAAPPKESREENMEYFKGVEEKRKAREEEEKAKGKGKGKEEKESTKEKSMRRNPIDAFPGELIFFMRVLNLLRGVSSSLGARTAYLELMRPFAEAKLSSAHLLADERIGASDWVYPSPLLSPLEAKLRSLLVELGREGKVVGAQVCIYKDGEVVVDSAAGVMGKYDPRPVLPSSLFSVFSATKGVTAALLHWLADRRKLQFGTAVKDLWPEFGGHGKDKCTVANVLTHTAGLQNALAGDLVRNPNLMCDWDGVLKKLAEETPEIAPPHAPEAYHYLSFGWLAGGIAEKAYGGGLQDLLKEALTEPLGVEGEFYIGIPSGVESRLATLLLDREEMTSPAATAVRQRMGDGAAREEQIQRGAATSASPGATSASSGATSALPGGGGGQKSASEVASAAAALPLMFNTLFIRRAIIPAANGHFSARALARFYAAMGDGGLIPAKPKGDSSLGVVGSEYVNSSKKVGSGEKRGKGVGRGGEEAVLLEMDVEGKEEGEELEVVNGKGTPGGRLFLGNDVLDACSGRGEFESLCVEGGNFGLGFQKFESKENEGVGKRGGFGHAGLGGSVAFCDPDHRFAVAITMNKLSQNGEATGRIMRLICSELGVPLPDKFDLKNREGADMMREGMLRV